MTTKAPLNQHLVALWSHAVERYGDDVSICGMAGDWSWRQLDRAADRVAARLQSQGIEQGDRISIYAINCPEFVIAYLGIMKTGAVVVPINVLINPQEISYIVGDAGVRGMFYSNILGPNLEKVKELGFQPEFSVCLDTDGGWEAWVGDADSPQPVELDAYEDLLAIIYTSGTTGLPKGAMLTHANLAANTWSTAQVLELRAGEDRVLVVLPMFHSFAATVGMLTSLLYGVSFIPVPKFDPELVVSSIEKHGATIFLGVPSMYNVLLRLPDEATPRLASLRMCASGGAAMPVEIMRKFEERYSVSVHEGDGPTECSPVTCINPLRGERKPGTVGLPVPLVEMRITDDQGNTMPDGEVGEICARGPNVMKGYWNRPKDTAEAFFNDWFRTGDLGTRDADGYFSIVDRLKDMIIVNGMNVYPRMLEEVLYTHPGIREAAVVGEEHESHGEIPVAYLSAVEGVELEDRDLRTFCKNNLGPHQLPRRFVVLDDLPKNATGKIMKRELRRHGEIERGVSIRR